jgi:hypothetical protein
MGGGGGSKKKRRRSGAGGSKKKRRRSGAPSNEARAQARASHLALEEVTVNGLAVTGLQDEWLLGMGSELVSVPSAAIHGWKVDDGGKSVECRSKEQTRHMLVHMCDPVQTAMGAGFNQIHGTAPKSMDEAVDFVLARVESGYRVRLFPKVSKKCKKMQYIYIHSDVAGEHAHILICFLCMCLYMMMMMMFVGTDTLVTQLFFCISI